LLLVQARKDKEKFVEPGPLSIIILFFAFILVALASAAEYALAGLNRGRIRQFAEDGNKNAHRLESMVSTPSHFLLTFASVKTLGTLLAGISIASMWSYFPNYLQFGLVAFGTWIVLVFIKVLARSSIQEHAERVALRSSLLLYATVQIFRPLTALLQMVGAQFGEEDADSGDESIFLTEDGLRLLLNVREEGESIEEVERQMIASILDMEETVAREVMVPRIDIVAVNVETPLSDALAVIIDAGHSRLPIYEGDIDRIIGFLYAKDLLKCMSEGQTDVAIRDLLRSAYYVPVSKKLNNLFREMQKQRVHVSVVVDEYGGTAGLITIEDILEEIVGEIEDEYDTVEDEYIQTVGPNSYLLNARLDVDSLIELLDIELPEDHADTLGGLMYSLLGRVPEQGESVEYSGLLFTIILVDGRRIDKVRVEPLSPSTASPESTSADDEAQADEGRISGMLPMRKESGA
jgi:putative hemolysin